MAGASTGGACGDEGGTGSSDLELQVPFDLPLTGYKKEGILYVYSETSEQRTHWGQGYCPL